MKKVIIKDITLRECDEFASPALSFKEKLETAKLLERLGVDAIETGRVLTAADEVLIRTLCGTLELVSLSVPVGLDIEEAERAVRALTNAKNATINVVVPVSAVRMEYFSGKKPDAILEMVSAVVARCRELGLPVEFTAEDSTRAEPDFLKSAITTAVEAGAETVTLCDAVGEMTPDELLAFIEHTRANVPSLGSDSLASVTSSGVELALHCRDHLGLAAASAIKASQDGVSIVKVSGTTAGGTLPLEQFLRVLSVRGDYLGLTSDANFTISSKICDQIHMLTGAGRSGSSAFAHAVGGDENRGAPLGAETDMDSLRSRIEEMGYTVSNDDFERIYTLFIEIARSKPVENRDIEALVAETAGQSAPTYQLRNYVINSGSAITATSCLTIARNGSEVRAISIGDGPIDASFLAIEDALGRKFELEDFQIRAVTEGREAMGDALVKLRSGGKLYSGRGLSTDIIGASIRAYLSAVNKIVHEEKN